jgi:sterol desaturase/sphingolipid hydroxylase (fatty acid hydroxylase superfamily)
MFGFIAGLIASNAGEWYMHKYVLHGRGKKKDSFWRFHWAVHHKTVMQQHFRDSDYEHNILDAWDPQSKEVAALLAGAVAVSPLFWVAPGFTAGVWFSQYNYYRVHKKSHLDPEWGYKYLPWHYDHHMAPDQDKNWCVTFPLWDYVKGTRVPYKGTDREKLDIERRMRKAHAFSGKNKAEALKENMNSEQLN